MRYSLTFTRWQAIAGTAVVFAFLTALLLLGRSSPLASAKDGDRIIPSAEVTEEWPPFDSLRARQHVNTTDKNIPTDWCNDDDQFKNIKWVVNLGTKAYGGPVLGAGRIFVGTNNGVPRDPTILRDKGVMMCFRQQDGVFEWQAVHNKLPSGLVNDAPEQGIVSAPAVDGNRLYYVSNRCELVCATVRGDWRTSKARIVWRLDMMKELGVYPHNLATCSPLIVGDSIFLCTSNGVDEGHINIPSPAAPSFIAVNKRSGKLIWGNNFPTARLAEARKTGKKVDMQELKDQGLLLMHGQWANPSYAEPKGGEPQVIFPGGDGWLYSFNPKNGALIWRFDCNPKDAWYQLGWRGTRSEFICTPVVWEDKVYIGTGQDPEHEKGVGHLWCIDITKTPKNKDKDLSPASKPPAKKGERPRTILDPKDPANKDSGLVWHYGGVLNPKPARGSPYRFGRTLSTVCIHDGLLYTSELDGIVHCIDAKTGKQYWQHDMNADTWASPYWVNGHVYIGNDKGKILVFKHGKEKKLVNTIDMNCGVIRSTPVAANGVLYLITENPTQLWAIADKGGK